jgi:hypothetical protein
MENTEGNDEPITNYVPDKQKLIHFYITTLKLDFRTPFDNIISALKDNFNYEISRDDLLTYFEPTLEEFTEDLEQQFKNLN